ncbi:hypothetical protein M9458_056615 [Cirrhinus mrigala]|uniref:Retrotransposon gag domain-containing protein n=1 Tax=Cirrhinus mrigala TaxID=683832 RepID=A0ABD0MEM0_CIRMR
MEVIPDWKNGKLKKKNCSVPKWTLIWTPGLTPIDKYRSRISHYHNHHQHSLTALLQQHDAPTAQRDTSPDLRTAKRRTTARTSATALTAPSLSRPSTVRDGVKKVKYSTTAVRTRSRSLERLTLDPDSQHEDELEGSGEHITAFPMIQAAGPEGTVMVFRPLNERDLKEAMSHLPHPRVAKPHHAGTEASQADWNHTDNETYRQAVKTLRQQMKDNFPAKVNTTKINYCTQKKDESVDDYYVRLYDTFNRYSRMLEPDDRGDVPQISLMSGLRPEIATIIKQTCTRWEDEKLEKIRQYALHAERLLEEKGGRKGGKELQLTTLTMYKVTEGAGVEEEGDKDCLN